MRTSIDKAVWRQAQSMAFAGFASLGAILFGSWLLLPQVHHHGLHDVLEGLLYVAAFFGVFTINPMTHYFYSRLKPR